MRRASLYFLFRPTLRAALPRATALPTELLLAIRTAVNLNIAARERIAIWFAFAVRASGIGRHEFPSYLVR